MLAGGIEKPNLWRTEYCDSITLKKTKKSDQAIVSDVKVTKESHGNMCLASLLTASGHGHTESKHPFIYRAAAGELTMELGAPIAGQI